MDRIQPVEASSLGYGVRRRIFGQRRHCPTPSDDKEPIPPRSIQLTAEQDHVIKEIVLKDMHIEQVPRSTEIRIGEKVPPNIELQTFPPLVAEKVPQVRTYKFFVTENQIVVVTAQNIIADIIK